MAGCSSEEPVAYGSFPKSALSLSVNPQTVSSRADVAAPAAGDFTVSFTPRGEVDPTATFLYGEMPEIISLPVGDYDIVATYGANAPAAWNAPYFRGATSTAVAVDDVTVAEPVVCSVANACVSVVFDEALAAAVGNDWRVDFTANGETLEFTPSTAGSLAFFAIGAGPVTATLHARLAGNDVVATHTIADPLPARNYHVTFRLSSL